MLKKLLAPLGQPGGDMLLTGSIVQESRIDSPVSAAEAAYLISDDVGGATDENLLRAPPSPPAASELAADPGNAGALPVTSRATINLRVADAMTPETRTIADPSFAGQRIDLRQIGAGTIAVTAASAIDDAGHTVMTFDADGDYAMLVGVQVGPSARWRLYANTGVAIS
jgi:hypothetical protein